MTQLANLTLFSFNAIKIIKQVKVKKIEKCYFNFFFYILALYKQ